MNILPIIATHESPTKAYYELRYWAAVDKYCIDATDKLGTFRCNIKTFPGTCTLKEALDEFIRVVD